MSETATEGVLYEKMFLEISQNSQENTRAFLMKPEACNFIKKETLSQVFSCEFCEISKSTFSYRTPRWLFLYIALTSISEIPLFPLSLESTCLLLAILKICLQSERKSCFHLAQKFRLFILFISETLSNVYSEKRFVS